MPSILDTSIWKNKVAPYIVPSDSTNPFTPVASNFADTYLKRRSNSAQFDPTQRKKNMQEVAADIIPKSAGNIKTNEYGLVSDTGTPQPGDLVSDFNKSLSSITKFGDLAKQTEEAKVNWQKLKQQQDLAASYNSGGVGLSTGGDNSTGGRAVALALQAYKNGTPYVWGGNSLTKGIDCSGLVQQVYSQLGINLPRTTYEQAKSGKIVNLNSLMPGDLVFYNTGSSDPNGIGQYSHVAIYTGNGQIVDARNTRSGMKIGSIYDVGTPVLGVRPW